MLTFCTTFGVLRVVLLSECYEWSAAPISAAFAVGHVPTFVLNAAVLASHWQPREGILHSPN